MKALTASTAIILALATPAALAAQGGATQNQNATQTASDWSYPSRVNVTSADELVGRDVRTSDGHDAGNVLAAMIDMESGNVPFVIVSAGGDLDMNGALAVPWTSVTVTGGDHPLLLSADLAKLKQAPRFDPANAAELTQPERIRQTYSYYGARPLGYYPPGGYAARGVGPAYPPYAVTPRSATARPYALYGRAGFAFVGPTPAAQLRDAEVKTGSGDDVGGIDKVMIDTDAGRVAYLLLGQGGFLGIGEEYLPVPLQALKWSPDQYAFVLNASQDELKKMPRLARDDLPAQVRRDQIAQLYQRFNATPYWQLQGQSGVGSSGGNGAAGASGQSNAAGNKEKQ